MSSTYDPNQGQQRPKKPPIFGQGHGLSDEEGAMIQQMIREEQHSARALYIPKEDLAQEATTQLSEEAARVIAESKVRQILQVFNRDYLYGQGRFDEYKDGLILKWGDQPRKKMRKVLLYRPSACFDARPVQELGRDQPGTGRPLPPAGARALRRLG